MRAWPKGLQRSAKAHIILSCGKDSEGFEMLDAGKNNFGVRLLRGAILTLMRILFRIEHSGMEVLPPEGPLLIVSNHVTYFDPFWIGVACHRRIRFMAWDKIFSFAPAGMLFRWLGAFPVSLTKPESGAYKTALRILKQGQALVIFPEGGRSTDGSLMHFKNGAANLAMKSGAVIVPVAIAGGEKVWSRNMRLPKPAKVRVFFLPPIVPDSFPPDPAVLMDQVRSRIHKQLTTATHTPRG
jgi:1-acyl-sn-glycerol-3-phosphate acyltransferase